MFEKIAEVAHEVNRAYCQTIGDQSQPSWATAPQWQKDSAVNGVKFHWSYLEVGKEPRPEMSHENWLAEKRAAGWAYGPIKDPDKKEHPCFMPYDGLPVEQRMKDYLFSAVVKAHYELKTLGVTA